MHLGRRNFRRTAMSENDRRIIAGFAAEATAVAINDGAMAIYTVAELESLVDRGAVLRGDVEPPYWAHLWTGARVLAAYIARWLPLERQRVLDLGCGLGLTGLVAAREGAEVFCVDQAAPALEFVAASAEMNRLEIETACGDFNRLPAERRFDLILAAEIAYDSSTFAGLAATIVRHLAPGGAALVADGYRTDTPGLYRAFRATCLAVHSIDLRVRDEGVASGLRLTLVRQCSLSSGRQ